MRYLSNEMFSFKEQYSRLNRDSLSCSKHFDTQRSSAVLRKLEKKVLLFKVISVRKNTCFHYWLCYSCFKGGMNRTVKKRRSFHRWTREPVEISFLTNFVSLRWTPPSLQDMWPPCYWLDAPAQPEGTDMVLSCSPMLFINNKSKGGRSVSV